MASPITRIAEAVKTELNAAVAAGTLTPTFTAVRSYRPLYELPDLATLRVTVVPRSIEATPASRNKLQRDVQVDVGVQQKIDASTNSAADALVEAVDRIAAYLEQRRLLAASEAVWVATEIVPFSPDHLAEHGVFTSVVSVTYRVFD